MKIYLIILLSISILSGCGTVDTKANLGKTKNPNVAYAGYGNQAKVSPVNKKDLWSRIPKGYKLSAVNNRRIQKFQDRMLRHQSYFTRISRNAAPYLYHIVKEVEKRGMPLEIALLPAIESAFKPLALSSKRAAGLWQFMPATGRDYGLRQNYSYDGRRDIIKSTRAALDYLQELEDIFGGDWLLALAAYNYGPGNVLRAIHRNERRGRASDYWSLKLPRETSEYVPKLLAFAKIVANHNKYGIKLEPIDNKPYFKQVNVGRQIELSLAAQLAELSLRQLKLLNPAYKRKMTVAYGQHQIVLPVRHARRFKQRLAKIPSDVRLVQASMPNRNRRIRLSAQTGSTIQQHKVSRGDNLWTIAELYGTTVARLRALNPIKYNNLKVGEFLKVPSRVAMLEK
jgi:membrane-bound lytic murein transglycosylase D